MHESKNVKSAHTGLIFNTQHQLNQSDGRNVCTTASIEIAKEEKSEGSQGRCRFETSSLHSVSRGRVQSQSK